MTHFSSKKLTLFFGGQYTRVTKYTTQVTQVLKSGQKIKLLKLDHSPTQTLPMSSADSCVLVKSSGVAEGRIRTQVTQILKSGQKIKNKLLKEDSSQLYQ